MMGTHARKMHVLFLLLLLLLLMLLLVMAVVVTMIRGDADGQVC